MGVIIDVLAGIPLNAVLRQRISEFEAQMTALKSENAVLKAKVSELESTLKKIQQDQTVHGDVCRYCHQPKGKLMDISPHKIFGEVGLNIEHYKCEARGKEYEREQKS